MKIKHGKYILNGDSQCMWVDEEYTNTKGNISVKKIAGYSRTFQELLESFIRHKDKDDDSDEITEIQHLVERFAYSENEMRRLAEMIGADLDKRYGEQFKADRKKRQPKEEGGADED